MTKIWKDCMSFNGAQWELADATLWLVCLCSRAELSKGSVWVEHCYQLSLVSKPSIVNDENGSGLNCLLNCIIREISIKKSKMTMSSGAEGETVQVDYGSKLAHHTSWEGTNAQREDRIKNTVILFGFSLKGKLHWEPLRKVCFD